MTESYYFDHNATTPVDEKVLEAMLPYFSKHFGNASSAAHSYGWAAAKACELAREKVAAMINADPAEITFTSGSTESISLALLGLFEKYGRERKTIISYSTEHKAVLETLEYLGTKGAEILILGVDRFGLPDTAELKQQLNKDVLCVAAAMANNETGVIFPIQEICDLAHGTGAFVFCDLTQAPGKIICDVRDWGIDLACLSAHKMYGPKGVGVLYKKRKNPAFSIKPLVYGGGQENGLRPGTLNVPGIVGMGAASVFAAENLWSLGNHYSKIRTWFEQQITDNGHGYINGSTKHRLPNTSNICFENLRADELIKKFRFMAISTGSACSSAHPEPSHVLLAMGLSKELASSSLRFSFGKDNTFEQVQDAAEKALKILSQLKEKN